VASLWGSPLEGSSGRFPGGYIGLVPLVWVPLGPLGVVHCGWSRVGFPVCGPIGVSPAVGPLGVPCIWSSRVGARVGPLQWVPLWW
jgi:hypothetical protein